MAIKRYVSKTGVKYTFLIVVNGVVKSVSFKGNEKDCVIKDSATQKAVEEHEYFINKLIGVAPGTKAGGFDEEISGVGGEVTEGGEKLEVRRSNQNPKMVKSAGKTVSKGSGKTKNKGKTGEETDGTGKTEFPEIIEINDAVEILGSEPYNIDVSKLLTTEDVKSAAEANNVLFPNLSIE